MKLVNINAEPHAIIAISSLVIMCLSSMYASFENPHSFRCIWTSRDFRNEKFRFPMRRGKPKVSTRVDSHRPDQIISHASRYPSRHIQLDPIGQQPKTSSL